MSDAARDGGVLDGFHVGYVPAEVGEEVSDFASEWEDVTFATRVWERQVPEGYRVDLRIHVLRGEQLTDLDALRDFLAEYHEREPADWSLTGFNHGEAAGLLDGTQAFWLAVPGVAVNVVIDPELVDSAELLPIAVGVQMGDERQSS